MKIKIFLSGNDSGKRLADAVVLIEEGDLRGCAIRGFNIWRGKGPDEVFITPPNRQYQGRDGKPKYYHHLVEEIEGSMNGVRAAIEEAYRAKCAGKDEAPPADDDFPI